MHLNSSWNEKWLSGHFTSHPRHVVHLFKNICQHWKNVLVSLYLNPVMSSFPVEQNSTCAYWTNPFHVNHHQQICHFNRRASGTDFIPDTWSWSELILLYVKYYKLVCRKGKYEEAKKRSAFRSMWKNCNTCKKLCDFCWCLYQTSMFIKICRIGHLCTTKMIYVYGISVHQIIFLSLIIRKMCSKE